MGGTAFPWFSVDIVPLSLNADRRLLDGVPVATTPCRPAQVGLSVYTVHSHQMDRVLSYIDIHVLHILFLTSHPHH